MTDTTPMDRLLTMTSFAKVVEHSSFTAAADELGISRALVSRHVSDLEQHFGMRLLNRTTRSVAVSEAGQRYYDLCKRVLWDLRTGENDIAAMKETIAGGISVICPKWIGNFDISDAAVDFCLAHPAIAIQLHIGEVTLKPHEFLERGFDICIQPRRLRDSDVMVKKIGGIGYVLAAAPDYLERRGSPATLRDLAGHDCLTKIAESHWSFEVEGRVPLPPARFQSNSYFTLCTAAERGLGIALLPERVAARDLQRGTLRQVLPAVALEDAPLYAAYAPGGQVPLKVKTLVAFLANWFKERDRGGALSGGTIQLYNESRDGVPA